MVCSALRTAIPDFLFLFGICSEASAAYVGDPTYPPALATTVPAAVHNPPYFARLPDAATAPATHEIDIPTAYGRLVSRGLEASFTELFRILATYWFRTGPEGAI